MYVATCVTRLILNLWLQAQKLVEDQRKENSDLVSELRKAREALLLANLTIERQRKGGEVKAIPSSQKEVQLQKEVDKCMVRARCISRPCAC